MKKITIALMIWLSSFSAHAYTIADMIDLIQKTPTPKWLIKNDWMFNTGFPAEFGKFEIAMSNMYQSNAGKGLRFNQSGSYLTMYNGILKYLIEYKNNPDELYSLFIAVLHWENPKTGEIFIPKTSWGLKYLHEESKFKETPFMAVSEFLLFSLLDGKDLSYDYATKDSFEHIGEKSTIKPAELKNITPIFYTRNKFELTSALSSGSDSEIKKTIASFQNKYPKLFTQTFKLNFIASENGKQSRKETPDFLAQSCDMGTAEACNKLGNYYLSQDIKKDNFKIEKLFKKSCDMGNARGCSNLGVFYINNENLKGIEFLAKACEMGVCDSYTTLLAEACDNKIGDACFSLANLFSAGKGVEKDTEKSMQYLYKAANLGSSIAYSIMGHAFRQNGFIASYEFFNKSCELGESYACEELNTYDLSSVTKEEYSNSCSALGYELLKKEAYNIAYIFYQKACDLEHPVGCNNLAWLHEKGVAGKQDYPKAIKLYQKSCDLGYSLGCENLGDMQRQNN